jgi:hypothetical protein
MSKSNQHITSAFNVKRKCCALETGVRATMNIAQELEEIAKWLHQKLDGL